MGQEIMARALVCALAVLGVAFAVAKPEVQSLDSVPAEPHQAQGHKVVAQSRVDVQKLMRQNKEHKELLNKFAESERMVREVRERQARLGESSQEFMQTMKNMKSCNSRCDGNAKCHGVFVKCGDDSPCKLMLGHADAAKTLKLGESATSQPNCMKQCEAQGSGCKGVYVAKGSSECHLVLEHSGGFTDAGADTTSASNENDSSGDGRGPVTVNVNVHNYRGAAPASKGAASQETPSSVPHEIEDVAAEKESEQAMEKAKEQKKDSKKEAKAKASKAEKKEAETEAKAKASKAEKEGAEAEAKAKASEEGAEAEAKEQAAETETADEAKAEAAGKDTGN